MRKQSMALTFIPEEDEANPQLPDTPMFHRALKENISSLSSLQIVNSLDTSSEDETVRAVLAPRSANSSAGSLLCCGRSCCSTRAPTEAGAGELERLRRANYANEKIIMELSAALKQLQARLSCSEQAAGEMRLQLLEKNGEIETLQEQLGRLRYDRVEESATLRRQIVGLQGRLAEDKPSD